MQNILSLPPIWYTFAILSVLTLFGALGTIMSKNPVHSVIYLIVTFFSISAHYILLNAQFLAAVNIIVYAGAIMVLFLFVVMFLNLRTETQEKTSLLSKIASIISAGLLMLILVAALKDVNLGTVEPSANFDSQIGMVESLGKVLFSKFLLPFELASVLFLSAMVGAVMLGRKEVGERNTF
jgi:NADH-quinone oxidoreductase subunit J